MLEMFMPFIVPAVLVLVGILVLLFVVKVMYKKAPPNQGNQSSDGQTSHQI